MKKVLSDWVRASNSRMTFLSRIWSMLLLLLELTSLSISPKQSVDKALNVDDSQPDSLPRVSMFLALFKTSLNVGHFSTVPSYTPESS